MEFYPVLDGKNPERSSFESFVSDYLASPFQQHRVSPDSIDHPDPASSTDFSEPADFMQRQAYNILREHVGLECPKTFLFRLTDELFQQNPSNAFTSEVVCDIDTNFGDPTVNCAQGNRRQSSPTYNTVLAWEDCDQPGNT